MCVVNKFTSLFVTFWRFCGQTPQHFAYYIDVGFRVMVWVIMIRNGVRCMARVMVWLSLIC